MHCSAKFETLLKYLLFLKKYGIIESFSQMSEFLIFMQHIYYFHHYCPNYELNRYLSICINFLLASLLMFSSCCLDIISDICISTSSF